MLYFMPVILMFSQQGYLNSLEKGWDAQDDSLILRSNFYGNLLVVQDEQRVVKDLDDVLVRRRQPPRQPMMTKLHSVLLVRILKSGHKHLGRMISGNHGCCLFLHIKYVRHDPILNIELQLETMEGLR